MLILIEVRALDREVCFGIMKNFYLDVLCLRYIFDDQMEMFSKQQDLIQRRVEVRTWRSCAWVSLGLKMTFKAMRMEDITNCS